ncbi:hypothetical protein GN244_ATG12380 [Phytophthora infestans]|uniref:Uncharacterized protein n=1 Tax=Phytophthora infestans TaxID=4787 RepID=A0A833WAI8_PHYIN|nr:hypothetical protein GN244_ATG12380 [Phytophthora infestans]KAF4147644.1 hypothetical protein GN958_ATG02999 [Phytophthora infestans]
MPRKPRQKDVSPQLKVTIALYLAQRAVSGRLPRGSIAIAASGLGLHRHTISKVWRLQHNSAVLLQARERRSPPPRRLKESEVVDRVRDVPLCQRQKPALAYHS